MPISDKDKTFIEELLADELDYDRLTILDKKLQDADFREAYEAALDAKYKAKHGLLRGYLPMIVLLVLLITGLILIFTRT